MKYIIFASFLFLGCSLSNTTTDVKNFAKCYVNKIPAPFWVCYQSSFSSVGKIHCEKMERLKQEEAFSMGVSDLINKLQTKTKLFLRRIENKNKKMEKELLNQIKSFVIVNAIQGDSWYSTKEKMLYVEVKVDKKEFEKLLFSYIKDKKAKEVFNEIF